MRAGFALVTAAAMVLAQPAFAASGADDDPISVHFKRGSDSIQYRGALKQNVQCCAYSIKAHAGQTLYWRFTGPAFRAVIAYPDGQIDGPGIPTAIPLRQDGVYVLTFSPNLMADGAFGRFVLTIRIPPRAPAR